MLASLCLALATVAADSESGYRTARVELAGPLSQVVFRVGEVDVARFVGELGAGEEREFRIPFPLDSSQREPVVRVEGTGAASIVEWTSQPDEFLGRASRRTRPPVARGGTSAPLTSLLVLAASLILVLGLRKRPLASVAVGVLLAWVAGGVTVRSADFDEGAERVFEGEAGSDSWLRVETARGQITCGGKLPARIEVFPEGRASLWTTELGPSGELAYRLEARAATISCLIPVPANGNRLARERNDFGDLSETWVRAGAGGFVAHGAWRAGHGLPKPQVGATAPPGWLVSGLPQGTTVLVGRLSDPRSTESGASESLERRARPSWVRLTGF